MTQQLLVFIAAALITHTSTTYSLTHLSPTRISELTNLGKIYELTNEEELETLIKTGNVIVEFTNPDYCNPCKLIKPVLESVAQQFKEKLLIIIVHTGDFKNLTWKYDIRSIPSLLFYKNGAMVHETSDPKNQGEIVKLINKYLLN